MSTFPFATYVAGVVRDLTTNGSAVSTACSPCEYQAPWPRELINSFYNQSSLSPNGLFYHQQVCYDPQLVEESKRNYTKHSHSPPLKLILKQIIRAPQPHPYAQNVRDYFQIKYGAKEFSVKTPDGVILKGMFYQGWHAPHKALLFCNPNETSMENIGDTYLRLAMEAGCSAIIFNQRGLDQGEVTPEGLVLDAFTIFRYLTDVTKILPSDIAFYGTSMGGGWSSQAAAMVQREYPDLSINLINERSFSSLQTEVVALSGIFGYIIPSEIFNSKAAVESLKGRVCIIYHGQDPLIPYAASLNAAIQAIHCCAKTLIRIKLLDNHPMVFGSDPHLRPFTTNEYHAVNIALKDVLGLSTPDYTYPNRAEAQGRLVIERA